MQPICKILTLLTFLLILGGCSQNSSEPNLEESTPNPDELKGPAAILIETWRAEGLSDKEILKYMAKHMNSDGTELYYDKKSKELIERVKNYTVEGTNHTLKEFMDLLDESELLNEKIVWVDPGTMRPEDLMNESDFPTKFAEEFRMIGISENSKEPQFKLLMHVVDDLINVYKVKLDGHESFNNEAELTLNGIYNYLIKAKSEKENLSEAVTSLEENSKEEFVNDVDTNSVDEASYIEETTSSQIIDLVGYFLQNYVEGDISNLEYFVHPLTNFYSEHKDYMESLKNRGINVELIDFSIKEIKQLSENKYVVKSEEYFTIDNPEKGYRETEQTSTYTIEWIDGEFYITGYSVE